jgi:hypothetical protein
VEYDKVVGESEPRPVSDRLSALEQLKTDGLISDEEYRTKRREILAEL